MTPTKLLYLEDFTSLSCEAKVLDVLQENGRDILILDQTVFYPQGGGQPYDTGVIEVPSGKFVVEEVRWADGIVKHIGKFEKGVVRAGEAVTCHVDENRRSLLSRIHSAGHVVDLAITQLKFPWIPGKGYHFPEGPYVEYAGSLEGLDRETLKVDVENLCNTLAQAGREVKAVFMSKEEMNSVCHFVPDNIPVDKPARVIMFGDFGIPCGGTHVKNLSEIRSMTIRKIKLEGATIRVAYDVVRE